MLKGVELLTSWQGMFGRRNTVALWSMIPHCFMWGIWQKLNIRTFEGCRISISNLMLLLLKTLSELINASVSFSFNSLFEMLDTCTFNARCW